MRLCHNLASLNIYNQLTKNEKVQSRAMDRVSTGDKTPKSSDGPYKLGQSENQRMQIRALQMAQRNAQDGVSMLQTVDDALGSVTGILQRIRELTVQAGGVNSDGDKKTIQDEIDQMKKALDDTVSNTEFNGVKLIKDTTVVSNKMPNNIKMTVGSNPNENVAIPLFDLQITKLGNETTGKFLNQLDVTSQSGIAEAFDIIDSSINTVLDIRAQYGSLENRFTSLYDELGAVSDSIQKAESGIRDADIAEEMVEFTKTGILIEAGNALMVQTNNFPREILRILENVRR